LFLLSFFLSFLALPPPITIPFLHSLLDKQSPSCRI
jgi:hypothetical protein